MESSKGSPVDTADPLSSLIELCEQQAATCTSRLAELDRRGLEALNCSYTDFREMTSAYARAARDYLDAATALKAGNTKNYGFHSSGALSAHSSAVADDNDITGEELPSTPRRRDLRLPAN